MLFMTSFYNHLTWFFSLFFFFFLSFFSALYVRYINESFYLSLSLFSFRSRDLSLSFFFDYMSLWFRTLILLISSVIMLYSYFYMAPYRKSVYFLVLTNMFILSMLLVVNISNLFFLMLGWDGLGLVSFFLIIYYQNQRSITSGTFTLLMNRLGDSFFLAAIMLSFYVSQDLTFFGSTLPPHSYVLILLLTFMTKRAIFPFSPWLPMAIAAPTPISALVHSSTLVTAGLYLIMRFSYVFYSSYSLIQLLLVLRLFTSFYAGINSIFEKDLKKIIALSTLSHLGFIGMAFSVGLLKLAFFHMLTHALFKSLLFITIGDIIVNLNHSQDIRYLSSGVLYAPISSLIMCVSLLNLLGLPNLRGYFSKDLILEIMNFSGVSLAVIAVMLLNVFFTYFYTYQLFYFSFQPTKLLPYQNFNQPTYYISISTLGFGFYFNRNIEMFFLFYPVPLYLKLAPVTINLLVFLFLILNKKLLSFVSPSLTYYFSNMMYLSTLALTFSSNAYYHLGFMLVKTVEVGALNFSLNTYHTRLFLSLSSSLLNLSIGHPIKTTLWALVMFGFLCCLILLNNITYYIWLLLIKFQKWI